MEGYFTQFNAFNAFVKNQLLYVRNLCLSLDVNFTSKKTYQIFEL